MKKFEKIIKGIWTILNNKIAIYAMLIGFALFYINNCNNIHQQDIIDLQNISALSDSLHVITMKNGDLQVSIDGYIGDSKELKQYNKQLADQLSKEKGKVVTLNNIVFNLKQDSTDLQNSLDSLKAKYETPVQVNDSTWDIDWTLPFIYDSLNYDIYTGRTQIRLRGEPLFLKTVKVFQNNTKMLNRDSKMSMTWGQKYDNGKLKVFARTSHPAFKAQLLEGTYVDFPKKKHWFQGIGIGPSMDIGWDFINNKPSIVFGVGLQFNIYQW